MSVNENGQESDVSSIKIEEFFLNRTHPLLNYVFFGENSAEIPKRYSRISEAEKEQTLALGDSISKIAQATLMQNVSKAMKEGGPVHAVEFCNLQAMPLTDSISKAHHVTIQRVTDKNRNPNNGLKTDGERSAWKKFKETFSPQPAEPIHFVQEEGQALVYYKPIAIGMPTCLKCHGAPEQDIDGATAQKINEKYPNDKATNYQLGDLRGMWKITFAAVDGK